MRLPLQLGIEIGLAGLLLGGGLLFRGDGGLMFGNGRFLRSDGGGIRVVVGKEHGLLRVVGEQAVLLVGAEGQEFEGDILLAVCTGFLVNFQNRAFTVTEPVSLSSST